MKRYLDENGLEIVVRQIKNKFATKSEVVDLTTGDSPEEITFVEKSDLDELESQIPTISREILSEEIATTNEIEQFLGLVQ